MSDTEAPKPKAHTLLIRFDDTPDDQALYAALSASSIREHRAPLPRQTKWLLRMAMGLREPDLFLLKRLGFTDIDEYDLHSQAAAAIARKMDSGARPATTLRLIPGGRGS